MCWEPNTKTAIKTSLFILFVFNAFAGFSQLDTIRVASSEILILADTIYAPRHDTIIIVSALEKYRVRSNPYKSSEAFYQNMEEFSGGNKITAQLFDLLFVNQTIGTEEAPTDKKRTSNAPFMPYEGFVIRNITIKHVGIIEGSVNDTARIARSAVAKLANRTHLSTWNNVIRNNLLIDIGEPINPYTLADNERILRRLRFIEDARIYIRPLSGNAAEIIVVVKDRISWAFSTGGSNPDNFRLQLYNRNIAGSGKSTSATWFYNAHQQPKSGYEIRVAGQNIDQTITNWELHRLDNADTESWGLNIQKEFVTPEIKYGGGIELRAIKDSTIRLDGERVNNGFYDLKFQDLWIGRSFVLPSRYNRKNLIIAARYLHNNFDIQPFVTRDSNSIYFNRNLFLGELTFSDQKYMKSNYMLSFGISEDIPIGFRYSIVFGHDANQFYHQNYFGFRFFWSHYFSNLGYLLINQSAGTFDYNSINQGVIKTKLDYVTPLFSTMRYRLRNFFTVEYATGVNQPMYKMLSLRDRVRDIQGSYLTGNGIFTAQVESVIFTPWYFYGFRFAPFAFYTHSNVWDNRIENNTRYRYSSIGGGFRIRNESLVFNTFEFRVSHFLPQLHGASPTRFSFLFSIPLAFNRIFEYKPTLVSYR